MLLPNYVWTLHKEVLTGLHRELAFRSRVPQRWDSISKVRLNAKELYPVDEKLAEKTLPFRLAADFFAFDHDTGRFSVPGVSGDAILFKRDLADLLGRRLW